MQDKSYVPFTEEMKKDYTILVPNMLPVHFKLIISVFSTYGYKMELLETEGQRIAETGLKYTHNDTCYPAILVIGQFMEALLSGRYDTRKTALIMFQTGGGCRASNYISLIRKALVRAGLEYVPVISFNMTGLEKHPGFRLGIPVLRSLMYAVLYGDLLMSLVNQVRPYEAVSGSTAELSEKWTKRLGAELGAGHRINYKKIKENYKLIIEDFAAVGREERNTVKVGIVGEIFVKYSPLGNNGLESFLLSEGAEVIVLGLVDFCLCYVYNKIMEREIYKKHSPVYPLFDIAYRLLCRKKDDIDALIKENGAFSGWMPFPEIVRLTDGYIDIGVKMGEGWLLTAEMLELVREGCANIVCTQPFGCLPNHICGKGMMKPIKEKNPGTNIVAIDYDAGASRVNQENRLKLMLFNARKNMTQQTVSVKEAEPEKVEIF